MIIIGREVTKPIEDSTRRNRNIIKDTACDKNFTYGEAMKTLKSVFKMMLWWRLQSANQMVGNGTSI